MQYYFLEYTEDIYLKGETNSDFTKFGVHLIKDVPDSMFQVNCPFEVRIFRNEMVKCIIDFENYIVSVKSLKREGKRSRPEFDLVWNIHPNKQNREEVFKSNKQFLFEFFDSLNFGSYIEIKRQLRYAIKKLIYLKFHELDYFFNEMMNFSNLKILLDSFYDRFTNLKNQKLELFINKKNDSDKISSNFTNVENIEEFSKKCKIEISLISENFFNSFENYLDFFVELLNKEYFSDKYSKFNDSEYFMYSETIQPNESSASSELKESCNNKTCNISNTSSYLFEKSSFNILKIKNNKFKIFYDKNQNLLDLEFINNQNDHNNHIIQNYYNQIKNLEISYQKDKNSNSSKCSVILNQNFSLIKNEIIYIGEYKDDCKNGFGFEIYCNPKNESNHLDFYLGNYKNDKYHNYGILNLNSYFYTGEFNQGTKTGKCLVLFKQDREIYEGSIDNNILNGKGKYYFNKDLNMLNFQGEIINNQAEGKGKIEFSNGDSFIGEFSQHVLIGQGKYSTKNNQFVDIINSPNGQILEKESIYKY